MIMKTIIRIRERDEKSGEKWKWLIIDDYGIEERPYIYIKKDYKGIKVYTIRLWADGGWEVVDEYP